MLESRACWQVSLSSTRCREVASSARNPSGRQEVFVTEAAEAQRKARQSIIASDHTALAIPLYIRKNVSCATILSLLPTTSTNPLNLPQITIHQIPSKEEAPEKKKHKIAITSGRKNALQLPGIANTHTPRRMQFVAPSRLSPVVYSRTSYLQNVSSQGEKTGETSTRGSESLVGGAYKGSSCRGGSGGGAWERGHGCSCGGGGSGAVGVGWAGGWGAGHGCRSAGSLSVGVVEMGRVGITYQLVQATMVEVRTGLVMVHGQLVIVKVVAYQIWS